MFGLFFNPKFQSKWIFRVKNWSLEARFSLKNWFGLRYTGIFVVIYVKICLKNDVLVLTAEK